MEFGFKEIKKGYAKAEVDAYIINLQNLIDEFEMKNVRLDRKYKDIGRRAEEIKRAAYEKAAKINAESEKSEKIRCDAQEALKMFVSTQRDINKFARSVMRDPADGDTAGVIERLDELESQLDLDIDYLKSLKYH